MSPSRPTRLPAPSVPMNFEQCLMLSGPFRRLLRVINIMMGLMAFSGTVYATFWQHNV